eukprot:Opistho-1_new@97932
MACRVPPGTVPTGIMTLVIGAELSPKLLNLVLFAAAGVCIFASSEPVSVGASGSTAYTTATFMSASAMGAVTLTYFADRQRSHRWTCAVALAIASFVIGAIAPLQGPWAAAPPLLHVATFCLSAISPIVDSATLALLRPTNGEYGKQRLWGTVGWYTMLALIDALFIRGPKLSAAFTALAWPAVIAILHTTLFVDVLLASKYDFEYSSARADAGSSGPGSHVAAELTLHQDVDGCVQPANEVLVVAVECPDAPHISTVPVCEDGKPVLALDGESQCVEVQCTVPDGDDSATPAPVTVASDHESTQSTQSLTGLNVPRFVHQLNSVAFFLAIAFCGAFTSAALSATLLLTQAPGSLPLTFTIQCVSEVAVLYHAHKLVLRLGAPTCVCVGLAAFSLRMGYYSVFQQARWLAPFVEPLHGISAGLAWAAAVPHADAIAPETLKATAQGVLTGAFLMGQAIGIHMADSSLVSVRTTHWNHPLFGPLSPPPEFYTFAACTAACVLVAYASLVWSSGRCKQTTASQQQLS